MIGLLASWHFASSRMGCSQRSHSHGASGRGWWPSSSEWVWHTVGLRLKARVTDRAAPEPGGNTGSRRGISEEALEEAAAGRVEQAHVRDQVANPIGISHQGTVVVQRADVVLAVQQKPRRTPICLDAPL